ncbi:fimbrial protein [Achromobacter sp. JUb104]|uniref:fimbrial protein n=1 Tax=Achromobacter sp. JUb104 TaxID=2940590 RepID=UPI00216A4A2B|nr:fimbrial protein [Achromobacter sp. JUb104]MCS3509563.1 type 1 fimbria pilin [Achromobacter sp. JUb104]
MKITLRLAVFGFALLMSAGRPVWAACTGQSLTTTITAQHLKEMKPPRDAAIGSTIYKKTINEGIAYLQCNTVGERFEYGLQAGAKAVPGYKNVYESGIPGIGMRIFWTHEGGVYMNYPRYGFKLGNYKYYPPQHFEFELIKIGPIKSGVSFAHRADVYYGALRSNMVVFSNVAYEVNSSGCTVVDGQLVEVELLTINNRHLGHRGATAADKAFNIKLDCDQGVKVAYRIDADGTPEHVIKNAQGGDMARGVGVQLLQGDLGSNVVQPLATRTEFTTTVTTVDKERLTIPLVARYYQTDDTLVAGKINATATVTLFYE